MPFWQVFCIFLFLVAVSLFGTLIAQVLPFNRHPRENFRALCVVMLSHLYVLHQTNEAVSVLEEDEYLHGAGKWQIKQK
jgi:hypothetical protein